MNRNSPNLSLNQAERCSIVLVLYVLSQFTGFQWRKERGALVPANFRPRKLAWEEVGEAEEGKRGKKKRRVKKKGHGR